MAALRRLAPHYAHYTQRCITGALFRPAEFDDSRIAVLRDPPDEASRVHIYLFANTTVPLLQAGVLEITQSTGPRQERDAPPATGSAGASDAGFSGRCSRNCAGSAMTC